MSRQSQRRNQLSKRLSQSMQDSGRYQCESLERRVLLTGTWTPLVHTVPASDSAQTMLLLSDGSVMVQGGSDSASAAWYKLKPVQGSYTNGTWSTLASMHVGRLFYASVVLPSGKVFVLGGEVATDKNESNSDEIYDPVANTWTNELSFPEANFGDGMAEVLSDGRVLAAASGSSNSYIYNPLTNSWSGAIPSLNGDPFSEEGWVKLPDNSLLDYQLQGNQPQSAARFVLGATDAQDAWVYANFSPVALGSNGGDGNIAPELGPGFLLPDGRVLWIGASSNTAFYTPGGALGIGQWTQGLTIPSGLGAIDAPGAVLPNGRVLFAASPHVITGGSTPSFASPTTIFEYDPIANTITTVPNTNGPTLTGPAFTGRMLVLPSGQVLYTNQQTGGTLHVYSPDGGPSASWAPTISNITNDSGSNVFTLSGYQLNGISEGAAYGDDATMASNYPIVKLTDQAGNVTFARTFNWSSTGVSSAFSTVNFTLAPGQGLGAYLVNVIANGIASPAVLDIQCSPASGENFSIQADANTNYTDIALSVGGGAVATFYIGAFSSLILTGDAASNTLVINDNLFGRPTTINGGDGNDFLRVENNGTGTVTENGGNGDDFFDFGFYARNLGNITGFTNVYGGGGTNSIFVYDNSYTGATTYSVTLADVSRTGWSGFFYDANVQGIVLNGGTGISTFNVTGTYTGTPVTIAANAAGTVNVGSGGSVQSIDAPLYLDDSPSYLTVNVDDSTDSAGQYVTMGTYTPAGDSNWGYIAGLSPANINYKYADTASINVSTGTSASNTVNILATGVATNLNGAGGTRVVNVGNTTQGVQGILGTLVLNGSSGLQTVNIDDTADTAARTTVLDFTTVNGYTSQRISGLAPVPIDCYLSGTTALSIKTSAIFGEITNILQLAIATSIIGTSPVSTDDIVNIGNAGSLTDITATIAVTHPPGYTDINVNGYANTNAVNYTFSSFTQGGIPWGQLVFPTYTLFGTLNLYNTLTYTQNDIGTLTVNPGPEATAIVEDTAARTVINELSGGINASTVSLTLDIQATTRSLNVNTTDDDWYVNAGNAGSVQAIYGPVTITSSGFGSFGSMVVDDSTDAAPRTATISDSQMIGLAPAIISYPQFRTQYTVDGGTGGNNFAVTTTPVGGLYPTNVLNSGDGNDTVIVDATQSSLSTGALIVNGGNGNDAITVGNGTLSTFNSPVTVNGGAGNDTLTLDDHTLSAADTYAITSTTVTRPNFALSYGTIELLTLLAETGNNVINVNSTAAGTPVTVNAEAGVDTINVIETNSTAPVTIAPSPGNDAVNVNADGAGSATAVFAATQNIGALAIGNAGKVILAASANNTLTAASVSIGATGRMDLNNNALVVPYTSTSPLITLKGYITTGFNAGAWNGFGIDSSVVAANPLVSSVGYFDSGSQVTIRATWKGDANADGTVNADDLSLIMLGQATHKTDWPSGNFNYDTQVNADDWLSLAYANAYSAGKTYTSVFASIPPSSELFNDILA